MNFIETDPDHHCTCGGNCCGGGCGGTCKCKQKKEEVFAGPCYYHLTSAYTKEHKGTDSHSKVEIPSLAELIRKAEDGLKAIGYVCVGASADEATHILRAFSDDSVSVEGEEGTEFFAVYGVVLYTRVESTEGKKWKSSLAGDTSNPMDPTYRLDLDLNGKGDVRTIECGCLTMRFCTMKQIREEIIY